MAKSVKINGVTYENVPSVDIPLSVGSGNATFYETSVDTAVAGDILATKTAHSSAGAITGSMTNNGAVSGTISTVAGEYTVPAGYHNGSGKVSIASAEQAKIISSNIKSGVTILGISGSTSVVNTSDATATASTILDGYTAYVGGSKITGSLTMPQISQDSTTKVLTIE